MSDAPQPTTAATPRTVWARLVLVTLLWGLNWPAVKIALGGVSPWALRAIGLACGGAILLALALARGRSLRVPRGQRLRLLVAGLLNIAGFNIFVTFAQLELPTSRAAILTFTMPLWVALISRPALGERIDRWRALALALGAAGLAVLMEPFLPVLAARGLPPGLLYVLAAALSWACGTVWLKRFPLAVDPIAGAGWQLWVGAFVAAAGMALFERPHVDLGNHAALVALGYHILMPMAVAYPVWFSLVARIPATSAALGLLLIPIFGVGGSVILLGDRLTAADLVGFALLLSATASEQLLRHRFGRPAALAVRAGAG